MNQIKNIFLVSSISILCLNPLLAKEVADSLKLVDYHVHLFSKALIVNLSEQGYNFKNSGFQITKEDDDYAKLSAILEDNTAQKIVLISTGYSYKKLKDGISESEFVKTENDLLAEIVHQKPERLFGFYGIDPLKDYALKEIIRCEEELKLHGIKLHLQANNLNLKDSVHLAKLKKVIALAAERDIPLLIHNNAWDKSLGKAYFSIFEKEILNEIDGLTIIFAHVGGGGGFFQFGYDFLKAFNRYQRSIKDSNTHKIYFELSGVVKRIKYPGEKSIEELLFLMKEIGFDKFLFGSDYPLRNSQTYFKELQELLRLEDAILKKISERDIFNLIREQH